MKPDVKTLAAVFTTFLKIGAFTFGGGYAMIPLIQKEAVERRQWITDSDVLDVIAIAESTPGPIAINAATFVGYRVGGLPGALCATLGVVLPSFVIILAIARVLDAFSHLKVIQYAFFGVRAGVLALIVKALYSMLRQCPRTAFAYAVAASAFIAVVFFRVSVLIALIGCAVSGLAFTLLMQRRAAS